MAAAAPDAGRHRSPAHHQGRRQLPRPPRRGPGLGLPGRPSTPGRPTGPDRFPSTSRCRGRVAALDPRRAVRPARRRAAGPARAPRRDRRDDHRAGDDEHRRRPAAAGLPRQALADLLHAHGALLTFDEVKTGLTIASGGRRRALRRRARHRLPRQGARRRRSVRRDRRHRGGDAGRRRRHVRAGRARSTATRSPWRRRRPCCSRS